MPDSRLAWARPQIVAGHLRHVISPQVTFIERNHDIGKTLLLMSTGRSGSTWLSEILVDKFSCRLIFEPFRRDKARLSRKVPWGIYADPAEDDPELHRVVRRILTGRVRHEWVDHFNVYRFPQRRLVKEIRATNLLPWIHAHFPEVPVIYLLRHPIPASWSAAQLGWKPFLNEFLRQDRLMDGPLAPWRELITVHGADPDLFHRHILRWCMENLVPISQLPPASVHVVLYEDMVENPASELQRLAQYLKGFEAGDWAFDPAVGPLADRPSRTTNWLHTPVLSPSQRLQSWRQIVPPDSIERAVALLREFGLDRVYDGSARSLVPVDRVLQGHSLSPVPRPEPGGPYRMQRPGTSRRVVWGNLTPRLPQNRLRGIRHNRF